MDANKDKLSVNTGQAHARVVNDYYNVTSSADGICTGSIQEQMSGIRRGLGDWLDVKGKKVLELGSGTGGFCWLAREMGAEKVVGVNLCEDEIAVSRKLSDADFFCEDVLEYLKRCPDNSFDVIVGLNILEHLHKDVLVGVLDNARRCLTSGGALIAMVPNATSAHGAMTRYWDITHCLSFTPSSVSQIMRLTGFCSVEFREWGPRVHGIISFIRYLLWQTIRFFTWFRFLVETGSGKGNIYTADMIFKLTK